MKVLMVNKFYYLKGGSETYMFALQEMLENEGIDIIPFAMKDKRNRKNDYEKYFVDNINYNTKKVTEKIKYATKIIYNIEANKKLEKMIVDTKPDIVHLHIFQHQISPSIIKVIKKHNIPIVYTVHDLKPVCLNYKMLNKNSICEECKNKKYYKCVKNKCVKNSYLYSLINTIEGYTHNILKSYENIDKFITPSFFYKEKLSQFGINENMIEHIDNFVEVEEFEPNYDNENYFVYLGRLSEEKGIKTLISSMKKVNKSTLKIVGDGPLKEELEKYTLKEKLENIEFLGFKNQSEVKQLVSKSKFLVIPSEWYENGPMSVIEAMSLGKAIIGSDIGGIPEMVKNNLNGYTFEAGNDNELAEKINLLLSNRKNEIEFGKNSRKIAEKKYSKKVHLERVLNVYKSTLKKREKYEK